MKKCNSCNEIKDIKEFKKHTSTKDRLSNFCRECTNKKQREYRSEIGDFCTWKYEKTESGFVMRMYRNMKSRISGVQSFKKHLYDGKEIMPKEEFYELAKKSIDFKSLFDAYIKGGCQMKFAPSVDRINPEIGYVKSNIRFITHSENSALGSKSKWGYSRPKNKGGSL